MSDDPEVLKAAAKLAAAGGVSRDEAVRAITSAIAIFGSDAHSARPMERLVTDAAEIERLAVNLAAVTRMTYEEALAAGRDAAVTGVSMAYELRRLYAQACQGGKS